jgi:hypothetical protein
MLSFAHLENLIATNVSKASQSSHSHIIQNALAVIVVSAPYAVSKAFSEQVLETRVRGILALPL